MLYGVYDEVSEMENDLMAFDSRTIDNFFTSVLTIEETEESNEDFYFEDFEEVEIDEDFEDLDEDFEDFEEEERSCEFCRKPLFFCSCDDFHDNFLNDRDYEE